MKLQHSIRIVLMLFFMQTIYCTGWTMIDFKRPDKFDTSDFSCMQGAPELFGIITDFLGIKDVHAPLFTCQFLSGVMKEQLVKRMNVFRRSLEECLEKSAHGNDQARVMEKSLYQDMLHLLVLSQAYRTDSHSFLRELNTMVDTLFLVAVMHQHKELFWWLTGNVMYLATADVKYEEANNGNLAHLLVHYVSDPAFFDRLMHYDNRIDFNAEDEAEQLTPLGVAIVFDKDSAIVQKLICCPRVNVRARGADDEELIHFVIEIKKLPSLTMLLASGRYTQQDIKTLFLWMLQRCPKFSEANQDSSEDEIMTEVSDLEMGDEEMPVSLCLSGLHQKILSEIQKFLTT